jgi:uncharacterized damage-inducible protein DinB
LSDAQLDATIIGGYGTIRDTLQHIMRGEVSYVTRVNGRVPAQPIVYGQVAGFGVLKAAAQWTGVELLQLACSARANTLVQEPPPNHLQVYPLTSLIAQALSHACEHRAQIAAIITQLGMEPPDMSGWCYMEETGELRDVDPAGA